jgi:hypothetical protein
VYCSNTSPGFGFCWPKILPSGWPLLPPPPGGWEKKRVCIDDTDGYTVFWKGDWVVLNRLLVPILIEGSYDRDDTMGRIALVDNDLAAILVARLLAKRDNMLLILLLLNYFSVVLIVSLSVLMRTDDTSSTSHRSKSFGLTHGNPKYQQHVQRSHIHVAFRRSLIELNFIHHGCITSTSISE